MEFVKETGLLLPRDTLESECDSDARGKDDTLNRKAIPRFHNPCSSKLLQPLLLISILLLFSNAIFAAKYFRARQQPPCQSRSSYSLYKSAPMKQRMLISSTADLEISLQSMRPSLTSALYTSPNITEANLAWESIQTSYAVVALKSRWVQEHDLAASMLSPTDPTKYVYILEAYHVLHCVVSSPLLPEYVSPHKYLRNLCVEPTLILLLE